MVGFELQQFYGVGSSANGAVKYKDVQKTEFYKHLNGNRKQKIIFKMKLHPSKNCIDLVFCLSEA